MLQPKAAAGRIARAVGGDRATEVELRPLAAATHDSDDEGDDWGLPALPVPRRHRSGPCPALDPRYSRAVAGGWLFGCAFTLVVLVLAATWVGPDPFSWEFALPEPTLSYSLSFERLRTTRYTWETQRFAFCLLVEPRRTRSTRGRIVVIGFSEFPCGA